MSKLWLLLLRPGVTEHLSGPASSREIVAQVAAQYDARRFDEAYSRSAGLSGEIYHHCRPGIVWLGHYVIYDLMKQGLEPDCRHLLPLPHLQHVSQEAVQRECAVRPSFIYDVITGRVAVLVYID